MILRQTVNFFAHLAGGMLIGMLTVAAVARACTRRNDTIEPRYPPPASETVPPMPPSAPS